MEPITVAGTSEVVFDRRAGILPERADREQVLVLTQPGPSESLARALADDLGGCRVTTMVVPDREAAKELEVVGRIYDRLAELNLGRHDTIVGVGGGAVTDLAGFVAATWLRGVESVLVPTTVLAAVDAAVGGKTGINRAGKNLVGAFWLPSRVVVDLDVLGSLPDSLLLEGSAEVLKAGLLADPVIVDEYAARGVDADLAVVVPRAIAVKAEVVTGDLRESGRRAILNLGHTIGHAVELLAPMPHGFAVSVGMSAAGVVSHARFGFDHRWLTDLLFSIGLPVAAAGVSLPAARELVMRDKKRTAGGVRMILLAGVGDPRIEPVSDDELELGMRSIGLS